jgi:hypothetical protein
MQIEVQFLTGDTSKAKTNWPRSRLARPRGKVSKTDRRRRGLFDFHFERQLFVSPLPGAEARIRSADGRTSARSRESSFRPKCLSRAPAAAARFHFYYVWDAVAPRENHHNERSLPAASFLFEPHCFRGNGSSSNFNKSLLPNAKLLRALHSRRLVSSPAAQSQF